MSLDEYPYNLTGALLAVWNNIILAALFIARLYKRPQTEYLLGVLFLFSFFPALFLLIKAHVFNRPFIYYLQLILLCLFIILEFLLDYSLKIDFRKNKIIAIPYVALFYAALGGMIGVASYAGMRWLILSAVTFLLVVFLSILANIKTGL
ncbi:hypothetical protein ACSSWA_01960 [Melioribacter sp. Ez-97]|uniref:hypothetical protein n=1 Tax=Melioribacter sp. Ez-97 TaxID=3423434 RepID=UPI003ED9DEF2